MHTSAQRRRARGGLASPSTNFRFRDPHADVCGWYSSHRIALISTSRAPLCARLQRMCGPPSRRPAPHPTPIHCIPVLYITSLPTSQRVMGPIAPRGAPDRVRVCARPRVTQHPFRFRVPPCWCVPSSDLPRESMREHNSSLCVAEILGLQHTEAHGHGRGHWSGRECQRRDWDWRPSPARVRGGFRRRRLADRSVPSAPLRRRRARFSSSSCVAGVGRVGIVAGGASGGPAWRRGWNGVCG
jgi:hypothetical protein